MVENEETKLDIFCNNSIIPIFQIHYPLPIYHLYLFKGKRN